MGFSSILGEPEEQQHLGAAAPHLDLVDVCILLFAGPGAARVRVRVPSLTRALVLAHELDERLCTRPERGE